MTEQSTKIPYIKTCKRLVVYGCSHGLNGPVNGDQPMKSRGSWGYLIAKHYDIPFINCSVTGTSPDWQIDTIIHDHLYGSYLRSSDKPIPVEDGDCIIIQWSHVDRVVGDKEKYHHMMGTIPLDKVHKSYYKHIYSDYWASAKVLSYAHAVQNTVKLRTLHAFTDGAEFFANQFPWNHLLSGIDHVGPYMGNIVNYIAPHHHKCFHANEQGHRKIADGYIQNLEQCF